MRKPRGGRKHQEVGHSHILPKGEAGSRPSPAGCEMLAGMEPNIQVAGTVCVNIWTRLGLDALKSGGDTPEGGGE